MRPEARSAKRSLPSRAREEESADGCRHTTRRFARETACDGARENAKAGGFEIVYDKSYPPGTTDMVPIVRAIQAANPDLVFACAYPPDTVGIVRAANEMGLNTKMFGGAMIGLLATPIKVQLGPLMNGLVIMESFIPAPTRCWRNIRPRRRRSASIPWAMGLRPSPTPPAKCWRKRSRRRKASITTSSRTTSMPTNSRPWPAKSHLGRTATKSRQFFTQFQGVSGNDLAQFRDTAHQVILWPPEYKTGNVIYPYQDAKKK